MKRQIGLVAATAALAVLSVATTAQAATTGADLQVSGSASSGSPNPGSALAYTYQVKNSGPDTADAATFSDTIPAGEIFRAAVVAGRPGACAAASNDAGLTTVSCDLGPMLKGGQVNVEVDVTAPTTAGTYANTGSATSNVADPNPGNNASTVSVQIKVATCSLPAGQTTLTGLVTVKYTNSFGLFENFQLQVGGVDYTVLTNFYDGTAPLTHTINLGCKEVAANFVQVANFVNVTGVVGSAPVFGSTDPTPVIYASVVQVLTFLDRA
jgi:uncharacterized repeat protein (TIGR01451 family)